MKVVALAGGVQGAKFADGLAQVLKLGELTVVVNTGNNIEDGRPGSNGVTAICGSPVPGDSSGRE